MPEMDYMDSIVQADSIINIYDHVRQWLGSVDSGFDRTRYVLRDAQGHERPSNFLRTGEIEVLVAIGKVTLLKKKLTFMSGYYQKSGSESGAKMWPLSITVDS